MVCVIDIQFATRKQTTIHLFLFFRQVAILKKDQYDNVYVCGGALVGPSHILTVAHCIKGYRNIVQLAVLIIFTSYSLKHVETLLVIYGFDWASGTSIVKRSSILI